MVVPSRDMPGDMNIHAPRGRPAKLSPPVDPEVALKTGTSLSQPVQEWSYPPRNLEGDIPVHVPRGKPVIWFQPHLAALCGQYCLPRDTSCEPAEAFLGIHWDPIPIYAPGNRPTVCRTWNGSLSQNQPYRPVLDVVLSTWGPDRIHACMSS